MDKNNVNLLTKSVLDVLEKRRESSLIPQIGQALTKMGIKAKNQNSGIIWSALSLDKTRLERINKIIEKHLNRQIELVNKVDTKLGGGFKVEVGDWVFDATLQSDFAKMENILANN